MRARWYYQQCVMSVAMMLIGFQASGLCAEEGENDGDNAIVVGKILKVDHVTLERQPPVLRVSAVGEVPSSGYKNPQLARVVYVVPPKDGVQEYYLTAVKPTGVVSPVVSKVTAHSEWGDYEKEAPWLKGIRVYGIGDGVKTVMFKDHDK